MTQTSTRTLAFLTVAGALALAPSLSAHDTSIASYIVGVDGLATITSGAYAGLPNPNYGRLTLLFAHTYPDAPAGNHYHSKGVYRHTGPNLGPDTATEINPNNFLPEGALAPLTLSLATGGLYDGKLVSTIGSPSDANYAFSFLTLQDVDQLRDFDPGAPETILLNSSGGRWAGSISGADVHLELVFLTPGLNVGVGANLNAFSAPGDDWHLGDSFSFTPTFWTALNAAPGTYVAQFKLTDESGAFLESGTFEYRFEVVAIPEPSAFAALAGAAALGLAATRRRRRA